MASKLNFKQLVVELHSQFALMSTGVSSLFRVDVDVEVLWDAYQSGFSSEDNPIFRNKPEHECTCCKRFVRDFGDVVSIQNGKIVSIWDFIPSEEGYVKSIENMAKLVKNKKIINKYVNDAKRVGTEANTDAHDTVIRWNHFFLDIPKEFIYKGSNSIESVQGEIKSIAGVFERGLKEITVDALDITIELIGQGSIYRGEEKLSLVTQFKDIFTQYHKLKTEKAKSLFIWEKVTSVNTGVAKIKNDAIGTLLMNISEGMDLDMAVKQWEKVMAPENYKRVSAIYTPKMVEAAKDKLVELGLVKSLGRRFAVLDDVSSENMLFVNRDVKVEETDVFDVMAKNVNKDMSKTLNKVQDIKLEDFIKDVLPGARSLEILLENRLQKNLVSLIAPKETNAPSLFKWNNPFSWAYAGNLTDSTLKQNVKNAGGNVEGIMRFSIQWNDVEADSNDLDAHCYESATGSTIYFGHCKGYKSSTGGMLDIDVINPKNGQVAVENIFWTDTKQLKTGDYEFKVNNYSNRGGKSGVRCEIEIDGDVYNYDYRQVIKGFIKIATVHYDAVTKQFTIKHHLESTQGIGRSQWGLETNQWQEVSAVTLSPNAWDGEVQGNKHFFFFLKNIKNEETPNGFFNEYLRSEFVPHRKVFEALGSQMRVEATDNQLSGVGFSTTNPAFFYVKVKGKSERVLKVTI